MGHINVTDEWLYRNMPLVNEAIVRELEKQTDDSYQFSKHFEKKMKKTIRKERRMNTGKKKYKLNFKAATAMACTMVLVLTVAINASAGKIRFFETVKTVWEDSFIYSYITRESNELKPKEPGYIPAGYKILAQDADTAAASFTYQNDTGEQIICLQHSVNNGSKIIFDQEYDLEDQIKTTDGQIDVYRYSNGYVYCYLEYRECIFTLYADNLDNSSIEHIFINWIHNKKN